MSKIGIFFAEGFEEIEALSVVDLCRRARLEIEMISVTGNLVVTGSHKIAITMDQLIEDVDFDSMDMIVLPGGMPGTRNLEAHELLMEQVDRFYQSGKYIAAICAAPSIFGHKGILDGRKACCFTGFEEHLTGATVTMDDVTVDGHVITSRGMGTAIPFGLKIVETFADKETADKLGKGIIYYKGV